MSTKASISLLILICIVLALSTSACGARWIIKGRVVDAETEKPIENAAISIYWGKPGEGPPGLAASGVTVEVAEDLSDSEGLFEVPKYSTLLKHYYLAVYKKGYVCWSSEKIFPTWEERKNFKLKDGMVIKLERFREEYSREDHARFTVFVATQSSKETVDSIFYRAIESEDQLYRSYHRKMKRRK
jgi:hypothetical protein